MVRTERDAGQQLLSAVIQWAGGKRIPVLTGQLLGSPVETVVLLETDDDAEGAVQLLPILDPLDVSLVVIRPTILEAGDVDAAVENLVAQGAETSAIAEIEACRRYIGHVSTSEFNFFLSSGRVVLRHVFGATWYFALLEAEGAPVVPSAEDVEQQARRDAAEREDAKWTTKARTEAARRVAEHPRFAQAKSNEAARVHITRQTLGSDTPENEHLVKEIGREAKAIFDLEIKIKK